MAAAFAVTGSLRGPYAARSGQSPHSRRFCAPRIPLPSMGSDPWHGKLKAQMDTDFIRQLGPAMHIDLLNRECFRYPVLKRKKLVDADQGKQRPKAFQKRARDFADGLLEYICSENENYKYVIIATKENANMLTKEGFISSHARDEMFEGLESIKKDIEEGKFQWRTNKDLRTNIIDKLIDIVGGPAKRLDISISHYVQLLTVLRLWCHDFIDEVISQIKELQKGGPGAAVESYRL